MSRRRGLFHRDEIILHLHARGDIPDGIEGPYTATREGMSGALGIRVNHISREIQHLIRSGDIVWRLAHVIGFRKRVKVYRLSEKGKDRAEKLIESLRNVIVAIPDELGALETMTLDAAYKKMGGRRGYLEILRISRVEALTESGELLPEMAKESDMFFGRRKELRFLNEWLTEKKTDLLIIYGIAGIGKTSLVSKFANGLKGWRKVYIKVHEWDTSYGILQRLANSLAGHGDERLQTLLRSPDGTDMTNVSFVIGDTLSAMNFLLIFDDVWAASGDVWNVLMMIVETNHQTGSRIVLISREAPLQLEGIPEVRGGVEWLKLEGLNEEESRQLLEWRGFIRTDSKSIQEIIDTLRGHPLLLKILRGVEDIKSLSEGDVAKFIHREIYTRLSAEERSLINTLAVLRYPVSASWLTQKAGYEVLASLRRKSLIEPAGNNFCLHDILRSFVLGYMKEEEKRRYHLQAGELLHGKEEYDLERIYHAIRAGKVDEAVTELVLGMDGMIAEGHANDILALLENIAPEDHDPDTQRSIFLIRMACLAFTGKYQDAISTYENAPGRVRSDRKAMLIAAESYAEIGDDVRAKRIYNTMKRHTISKKERAEMYLGLGRCHQNFGRYDAARECYCRALQISKSANLDDMIGRSLMGLGAVEVLCTRWTEATQYLLGAMKYVRRDANTLARVYANLSIAYYQRGIYTMALEMLERAEHIFNRSGNYVASLKSLLNRGTILLVMGRNDDAEMCLLKAREMSRRAGIIPLLAGSLMNLSSLYNTTERFEQAKNLAEESLDLCIKMNDERGRVVATNNLAYALVSLGRSDDGLKMFKENLTRSKHLGARGLIADTLEMLGEAYLISGDRKMAREYAEKALIYAKENGLPNVVKSAEQLIKKIRDIPS